MSLVRKSCCGSFCVVAGSDKCCEHEIRHEIHYLVCDYNYKQWEDVEWKRKRFRCPPCSKTPYCEPLLETRIIKTGPGCMTILRGKKQVAQLKPDRKMSYCDTLLETKFIKAGPRGKTILREKKHSPQLVPASYRSSCGHYCRDDGSLECCLCQRPTTPPPSRWPENMCDCCLTRHDSQRKVKYRNDRVYNSYSRGRTGKRSKRKTSCKLPALNHPLAEEVDEMCLDFSFSLSEEDSQGNMSEDIGHHNVALMPLALSSRDDSVLELTLGDWPCLTHLRENDGSEWPCLTHQQKNDGSDVGSLLHPKADQDESESDSECESLILVEEDEWELLSATGSVWTLESSSTQSPRSFRDAVLTDRSTAMLPEKRKVTVQPKGIRHHCCMTPNQDTLDDDFLSNLREEYKGGRGGKTKKMFHREHKGRRGLDHRYDRWDDTHGSLQQRDKDNLRTKLICKSLVA